MLSIMIIVFIATTIFLGLLTAYIFAKEGTSDEFKWGVAATIVSFLILAAICSIPAGQA